MAPVAVAVSGGVDSLAALLLLRGQPVIAVHGLFLPQATVPPGLETICRRLAIPFLAIDLRAAFRRQVMAFYIESLKAGLTPNPCAMCNRDIKFGALLAACAELGGEKLATGHYARLLPGANGPQLHMGIDKRKDQSYFLSLVRREALSKAIFPLGDFTKAEVREIAREAGFEAPVAAESQDICFLAQSGKDAFLQEHVGAPGGPILLAGTGRVLGEHRGLGHYTVGQRRGLGIAWSEPLYVRQVDVGANALWVAPLEGALMIGCEVGVINPLANSFSQRVKVKLRYNQPPADASVELGGETLTIALDAPMLATAPGQVATLYDNAGRVQAGGIVQKIKYFK